MAPAENVVVSVLFRDEFDQAFNKQISSWNHLCLVFERTCVSRAVL
jgi:hypothetical protein